MKKCCLDIYIMLFGFMRIMNSSNAPSDDTLEIYSMFVNIASTLPQT